ncbi:MAG: hypothetical protein QXG81_06710, partial [Ignisphaera sp.]
ANLRGGEESLYKIFSLIDAGGGCNSQLNGFINAIGYIDKELSQYDIAILLTNPITLSLDEPTNLRGLVTSLERLFIAMPMFKYDNVMGRDDIAKLLNGVSETLGETLIGMEFSEEGFEIIYGGEKP